jgi:hypothetical protein
VITLELAPFACALGTADVAIISACKRTLSIAGCTGIRTMCMFLETLHTGLQWAAAELCGPSQSGMDSQQRHSDHAIYARSSERGLLECRRAGSEVASQASVARLPTRQAGNPRCTCCVLHRNGAKPLACVLRSQCRLAAMSFTFETTTSVLYATS